MRRISFQLTERQFCDGSKDVTRRLGWANLKPGDRLLAVRKAMGLRKGEKQHVLGPIEVIAARREPLDMIDADECRREGFPELDPAGFVSMFTREMRCQPCEIVTRIVFRRLQP